jgi:RNA recognition motif-containing protein
MKLIVLNLPRDLSEDELVSLFKVYGDIKTCNLVIDDKTGVSKGFGFVEMALENDALTAIEELHRSKLQKNKIRVKPAA